MGIGALLWSRYQLFTWGSASVTLSLWHWIYRGNYESGYIVLTKAWDILRWADYGYIFQFKTIVKLFVKETLRISSNRHEGNRLWKIGNIRKTSYATCMYELRRIYFSCITLFPFQGDSGFMVCECSIKTVFLVVCLLVNNNLHDWLSIKFFNQLLSKHWLPKHVLGRMNVG